MKLKQPDSTKFIQINVIVALYFNSEFYIDIFICKKQTNYHTSFFLSIQSNKKSCSVDKEKNTFVLISLLHCGSVIHFYSSHKKKECKVHKE